MLNKDYKYFNVYKIFFPHLFCMRHICVSQELEPRSSTHMFELSPVSRHDCLALKEVNHVPHFKAVMSASCVSCPMCVDCVASADVLVFVNVSSCFHICEQVYLGHFVL